MFVSFRFSIVPGFMVPSKRLSVNGAFADMLEVAFSLSCEVVRPHRAGSTSAHWHSFAHVTVAVQHGCATHFIQNRYESLINS